jgi:hypothetical protein
MEFTNREELLNNMNVHLQDLLLKYDLDDIGIYEEEGPGDTYYAGYTVRKDGKVYMLNMPYVKDHKGGLALQEQEWTIQEETGEAKGFHSMEEVFNHINNKNEQSR